MTAPATLAYASDSQRPWRKRVGYLLLMIASCCVGGASLVMAVCGASSMADGYGGMGVAILDLTLIAWQLLVLCGSVIYAIVQGKRWPGRTGRPLTWLIAISSGALLMAGGSLIVFCKVPHKTAC